MGPFSPLATATVIALAVCLAGIFINAFKRAKLYLGYEEIADDVRRVARELKAEVFRDGEDLVISGGTVQLPTVLRFSHAESTPGMHIRVHAPVSFNLSIAPKGSPIAEGKVGIRTGHDVLDARFAVRTDHPTQVKMLLAEKKVLRHLEKLCCSSRTFLAMSNGVIELSELMIPESFLERHVLEHIESLSEIVKKVHEMPGAESVNIAPVPREQTSFATKAVVAAGALAALIVVFVAATSSRHDETARERMVAEGPEGVNPAEAARIPAMEGWRAAHLDEFSPDFLMWVRDQGAETGGHMMGEFSDSQAKTDSAYALIKGVDHRVVILMQGRDLYDYVFKQLAGIATVPRYSLQDIQWQTEPAVKSSGDALMVVSDAQNPASAVIVFVVGGRVYTGTPKDYRTVHLK